MKREHLAAIVAALALAMSSCGGDDSTDSSTSAASGTSAPEQAVQPQDESQTGSQRSSSSQKKAKTGSGGSSAPAGEQASGNSAPASKGETQSKRDKSKAATPRTPAEHLAALSPAERRHLHKDLYNQGKRACYYFGPDQIAENLNSTATDPVTLAKQFATAYEKTTPSLILPYQQGCIVGLRKFERNPPKAPN